MENQQVLASVSTSQVPAQNAKNRSYSKVIFRWLAGITAVVLVLTFASYIGPSATAENLDACRWQIEFQHPAPNLEANSDFRLLPEYVTAISMCSEPHP